MRYLRRNDVVRGKREPSADIRQAAAAMHEVFTALVDEGFSEKQALVIVGQMAAQRPPEPGNDAA
jgi:hypothetical protein